MKKNWSSKISEKRLIFLSTSEKYLRYLKPIGTPLNYASIVFNNFYFRLPKNATQNRKTKRTLLLIAFFWRFHHFVLSRRKTKIWVEDSCHPFIRERKEIGVQNRELKSSDTQDCYFFSKRNPFFWQWENKEPSETEHKPIRQ